MSSGALSIRALPAAAFRESKRWIRRAGRTARDGETLAVSGALAVMMLLPLAEAGLRRTLHVSIAASTTIVQHMVLVVGMLGGAIAAREGRLLTLSSVGENALKGRLKEIARVFTSGVSAAVCAFLCLAAYQFVRTESESPKILALGIPVWVVEWILPLGFAVIALRILRRTSEKWALRAAAGACAVLFVGAAAFWPVGSHYFVPLGLGILFVASVLGVPAFVWLGGTALILFWGAGQPIASIPISHYSLVINPSLPPLPLFTLAGYFLAEGECPKRLLRVFYALFGQFRGGPAIVPVLVCAFFTSFTGASGVTILALGGLLMPVLIGARYSPKDALGLLTGSGSLGLLMPPCLPLIVYAIVAGVSIEKMFLGGIFPALVMIAAVALWGIRRGPDAASGRGRDGASQAKPF